MPAVASVADLLRATADVPVGGLDLVAEPAALAVAKRSLESSGLGDGRITAGHLALLAERVGAGQLRLILFDGTIGADWSWTQRDVAAIGALSARTTPGVRA